MINTQTMGNKRKILIIIPAYNEESTIADVIKRIPPEVNGYVTNILVVDDGSTDKTAKEAREAGAIVYSHSKNMGLGISLGTGMSYAIKFQPAVIVNMDADGQFDPADIPRLVKPIIDKEAGFVAGSRFLNAGKIPGMPKIRFFGNKLITKLINFLTKNSFTDVSCGFRAYSYDTILKLNLSATFTYTHESFLSLCFQCVCIKEVPVSVSYFADRKSKITQSLWKYAVSIIIIIIRRYCEYNPLKFFGFVSSAFFSVGFILVVSVLIYFFRHMTVVPYGNFAIAGLLFNLMALLTFLIGLVVDMLRRLRQNQE
ncbi:MAG: glycosyltransferase family 2 protein [Candidatus Omnitrophota bacterium]